MQQIVTQNAGPSGSVRAPAPQPPRFDVWGVPVSAIDMDAAIRTIDAWIAGDARDYVCVTGVHGVIECRKDLELRAIHVGAGMVTPDGVPLTWVAKLDGHKNVQRVYGPDLMLAVAAVSVDRGWRHYFYGGGPGTAEALAEKLAARFPGLQVAGTETPPFRPLTDPEADAMAARINASGADIVWVGLSTPKQERFMSANRDRLDAPVLVGVGAAFDFHSGRKRQAPKVMQRMGLEWLFRAVTEPRRLGPRYLKIVPLFGVYLVWRAMRAVLRR